MILLAYLFLAIFLLSLFFFWIVFLYRPLPGSRGLCGLGRPVRGVGKRYAWCLEVIWGKQVKRLRGKFFPFLAAYCVSLSHSLSPRCRLRSTRRSGPGSRDTIGCPPSLRDHRQIPPAQSSGRVEPRLRAPIFIATHGLRSLSARCSCRICTSTPCPGMKIIRARARPHGWDPSSD